MSVAKSEFSVILTEAGSEKLKLISVIREITALGLADAKALVDEAPKPIKEGVNKDEAARIKAAIEAVGGKVEVK